MNGLIEAGSGEVLINGVVLNDETVCDARRAVGMVFQNPDNQFVGTTVEDDRLRIRKYRAPHEKK